MLHSGEGGFTVGEAALTGEQADTLTTILDGFVRLGYSGTVETEGGGQAAEMCDMVETIDLRFSSSIYIKMRAGVVLELVGRTDLFDKLRLALTAYVSKDEWKTERAPSSFRAGRAHIPRRTGTATRWPGRKKICDTSLKYC